MGAALNTASALYPTCWPTAAPGFRSRTGANSSSSFEGDKRLFNQYGVMLVNPARHPHVKKELGQQFIEWLMSPEGRTPSRLQDRWRTAVLSNADDPAA